MIRRSLLKGLLLMTAPRPDQRPASDYRGVLPAPQGNVFGNVIIIGTRNQLLVYSPAAGSGNLVASISGSADTDKYNNIVQPTVATYLMPNWSRLEGPGLVWGTSSSGTEAGPYVTDASLFLDNSNPTVLKLLVGGTAADTIAIIGPSGDSSGATDVAAINFALSNFRQVQLTPGQFFANAPITIPTGTELTGAFPVQVDGSNPYGAGLLANLATILTSVPGAGRGVIECSNTTGTQQGGQVIRNLLIEANGTASGSGSFCVLLHGAVGAGFIDNVVMHRSDGPCLRIRTDSGTGFVPDQWRINRCVMAASRSSHGVQADNIPDSTFTDCLSHGNALDGWNIGSSVNTNWIGCRGEGNSGRGWNINGFASAGEIASLTACSSELNNGSGFRFTAGTTGGTYMLSNCRSSQDGRAAGTTAGYESTGSTCRIMATGCMTFADATGPTYGALEQSSSFFMCFTGSFLEGVTAATHDDGSNTHALQSNSPVPF